MHFWREDGKRDLVFYTTNGEGTVSRVGIYVGNNEFISVTTSHGVVISSMSNVYWAPRYLGAKRYIQDKNLSE